MALQSNNRRRIGAEEWQRKLRDVQVRKEDMNRVVMNFLVTEGYVDAARVFERESGTAPGVDLDQAGAAAAVLCCRRSPCPSSCAAADAQPFLELAPKMEQPVLYL
jgi:hypothetical protein